MYGNCFLDRKRSTVPDFGNWHLFLENRKIILLNFVKINQKSKNHGLIQFLVKVNGFGRLGAAETIKCLSIV